MRGIKMRVIEMCEDHVEDWDAWNWNSRVKMRGFQLCFVLFLLPKTNCRVSFLWNNIPTREISNISNRFITQKVKHMIIWEIIYSNCGERYEDIDYRSYSQIFSSCEIKAWTGFSLSRLTRNLKRYFAFLFSKNLAYLSRTAKWLWFDFHLRCHLEILKRILNFKF